MRFSLPGNSKVNIGYKFFLDFDGTVTKEDLIDRVLEEFADPTWRDIEQSWVNGEIGSRDCLAMQTKLIRAQKHHLIDFVESIDIDETFVDFARYCNDQAVEIVILSDGIDLFIKSILNRYGLNDIRVFSNRIRSTAEGYEMLFPYFCEDCVSRSGVCKCKIMETFSSSSSVNILIGDGRSDFCIAKKADLTFAKSALLDFCRTENIPHMEHRRFRDILKWLRDHIGRTGSFVSPTAFLHHRLRGSRNGY